GHATQKALRQAMGKWIRSKGDKWKESERNKPPRCIVEELRTNVFTGFPPPMTPEEHKALEYVEEQRRLALQTLFTGKKITLKMKNAAKEAKGAYDELKTAASGIKTAATGGAKPSASSGPAVPDAVKSMFSSLFDGETMSAIVPAQVATFGQEITSSVI